MTIKKESEKGQNITKILLFSIAVAVVLLLIDPRQVVEYVIVSCASLIFICYCLKKTKTRIAVDGKEFIVEDGRNTYLISLIFYISVLAACYAFISLTFITIGERFILALLPYGVAAATIIVMYCAHIDKNIDIHVKEREGEIKAIKAAEERARKAQQEQRRKEEEEKRRKKAEEIRAYNESTRKFFEGLQASEEEARKSKNWYVDDDDEIEQPFERYRREQEQEEEDSIYSFDTSYSPYPELHGKTFEDDVKPDYLKFQEECEDPGRYNW